jgi:DNA-binding GntR family transcriptional regulator
MLADKAKGGSARHGRIQRQDGLVDRVYGILSADILSLKIPPDARVSVDNLAREFGVSQTPIREALSMLEAIGLVTKKHFVGYCTAPQLSRKQFEELFEIRLLIEPRAARRAAEKAGDGGTAELEKLVPLEGDDLALRSFAALDTDFHLSVARASSNVLVEEVLSRLHMHLHIFRLRFDETIARKGVDEHLAILRAFQRGDPDGAESAMRTHIENAYHRIAPFVGA